MSIALIQVTNVSILGPNPSPLSEIFSFEISFQCIEDLDHPLEWRLIYVGDPKDKSKDQEIENIEIFPIKKGNMKFKFESDPPDFNLINPDDIWGTTVILLEASYKKQDFIRIGWYLHNVYIDPILQDNPPDIPILDKLQRYIDPNELRVTRFNIDWSAACSTMSDGDQQTTAESVS